MEAALARALAGWSRRGSLGLLVGLFLAISAGTAQPPGGDAAAGTPSGQSGGAAAGNPADDADILGMDLDQLSTVDVIVPTMDVEVTSVAKQESTVGRSPAAIFVITAEMIRRSGATSIPETLRMVPGLEVARISSHVWAITARGFNGRFANKLLVLIDGRTVYTPIFSGVHWDVQDLLLEDVERIEVIRGPGGTLWGANAVNGVINIITKRARDTQGSLVTSGGGTEDQWIGGVRYGGQAGPGLHWRIWGKHFERDGLAQLANQHHHAGGVPLDNDHDNWRVGRGGFRVDWQPDPGGSNALTVQGDYYGGQVGHARSLLSPNPPHLSQTLIEKPDVAGGNVLARWTHVYDDDSDWALQLYYDRAFRQEFVLKQDLNIFDVEFQHRFPLGRRNHLIWGSRYRQVHDHLTPDGFIVDFVPRQRTTDRFSMFVQDEITVVDDRLFFTAGSKFEENAFTGFEYQPSARLLYTPDERRSAWGSISRSVRTPARFDDDARINIFFVPFPPPGQFGQIQGNRGVGSEELIAYEIGYRAQPTDAFAWDVAAFYNVYQRLVVFRGIAPQGNILPQIEVNAMRGATYGVEIGGHLRMSDCWRLDASYSFLQIQLQADSDPAVSASAESSEGLSPQNQVRLGSSWDLPHHLELDVAARYVDELPSLGIPNYITINVRLGWAPNEHLELSVVGQDLLDGQHLEFAAPDEGTQALETERGVFAKAVWRH